MAISHTVPAPIDASWMLQGGTHMIRLRTAWWNPLHKPVIMLHGWSADKDWNETLTVKHTTPLGSPLPGTDTQALLASGYTIYKAFTGSNWGTNTIYPTGTGGTGQQAIDDALTQAGLDGLPSDKAHLLATSAGACNALNWGWRNGSKLASMYLISPGFELSYLYDQDATTIAWGLGAVSSSLRSVHGGIDKSSWLTASTDYDPYRNSSAIITADIASRISVISGEADEVVPWSTLVSWCSTLGITLKSAGASTTHLTIPLSDQWNEYEAAAWFNDRNV